MNSTKNHGSRNKVVSRYWDPLWRPNDSVSQDRAPKLKPLPQNCDCGGWVCRHDYAGGQTSGELITRLAQNRVPQGSFDFGDPAPSVDVITGLIKANIPVRAALRVNSKVDSRTILDAGGAEDMLGHGDMLFLGPGQIRPNRVHGAFISDAEVNRCVMHGASVAHLTILIICLIILS